MTCMGVADLRCDVRCAVEVKEMTRDREAAFWEAAQYHRG